MRSAAGPIDDNELSEPRGVESLEDRLGGVGTLTGIKEDCFSCPADGVLCSACF